MAVDKRFDSSSLREERGSSLLPAEEEELPGVSAQVPAVTMPIYSSREKPTRASSESDDDATTRSRWRNMSCPLEAQHKGKELLNTVVALPIDAVFNLLFVQDQFMLDVYQVKKIYDVTYTDWLGQEDGQRTREVTFTKTLSTSSIAKVSYVTVKQVIQPQTQPGDLYVIELETANSGIPYGDAFCVLSHCCLSREEDGRTRLVAWVSVKYRRTLWGFIKSSIEKNACSGAEAVLMEVVGHLQAEAAKVARSKMGVRRRRQIKADDKARCYKHSPKREVNLDKSCNWQMLMVASLMVLTMGGILMHTKLKYLEHHSAHGAHPDSNPSPRYLGLSGLWEALMRIVEHQEEVHQHQLEHWNVKIRKASRTLHQVQESLELLLTTLPEHQEKLRVALQQHSNLARTDWLKAKDILQQQLQNVDQNNIDNHPQEVHDMPSGQVVDHMEDQLLNKIPASKNDEYNTHDDEEIPQ